MNAAGRRAIQALQSVRRTTSWRNAITDCATRSRERATSASALDSSVFAVIALPPRRTGRQAPRRFG